MAAFRKIFAMMMAVLMVLCASVPALATGTVDIDKDLLVLANSAAPLYSTYEPGDLVKLVSRRNNESGQNANHGVYTVSSSSIQLRYPAAEALSQLCNDAENAGVILYVRQGYRSYEDEANRYARLEKRGEAGQKPGENDYQTGLAVTVVSKEWRAKTLTAAFGDTKEAQWLAANCARYGFVLRYPQGKQDVTGWEWEPWHLRYVGRTAAEIMQLNNLCLEEFCQQMGIDGVIDMGAPVVTAPPVTPAPTLVPEAKEAIGDDETEVIDPETQADLLPAPTAEPTVAPAPEVTPVPEVTAAPVPETTAEPVPEADENIIHLDVNDSPFIMPEFLPEGALILDEYGPDGDYEISLFHD